MWKETSPLQARAVVIVSPDAEIKARLHGILEAMRWRVEDASGGAEAMAVLEEERPEALMVDSWLPDLNVSEFCGHVRMLFPSVDVLSLDGSSLGGEARSPRRNELLHALRNTRESSTDGSTWNAPSMPIPSRTIDVVVQKVSPAPAERAMRLPGLIGDSACMRELARLIRLVAPSIATVLIEGETGTGKELVAHAVHRLSNRSLKPFVVLNCAAIPESLLEAELFGHARGAFTGAVQSRTGRIQAADGGTLFLDEIGEMPLALQAKLLRFLESGELQRIGDNEMHHVNVRVVAATHQPLAERSQEGRFRLDLYHRLAIFPVDVPPLRERKDDLPMLVTCLLERLSERAPCKGIEDDVLPELLQHDWPGNVRELAHVLQRASILSGTKLAIGKEEIRIRRVARNAS